MNERKALEHEMHKRIAARSRAEAAAWQGRHTPDPEPPGDDWQPAFRNEAAFAAAGLCETWRMDQGADTAFFRFADFPPGFNLTGLWWRKA